MNILSDKNIIEDGFCWGRFEVTLDAALRIRLSKGIQTVLSKNKVNHLWQFPDPAREGLILCPPLNRKQYIETAMSHFTEENREAAYREYICTGEPATIDKQGRISFTSACIEHSRIKPGQSVFLLGVGMWYELWDYDQWLKDVGKQAKEPGE